jgi:DNA-binding NarL/FixJ family response regulator
MEKKRILVVEDHSITRRGLKNYLLSAYPEIEIEEARNGREALDRVTIQPPDVIIMDMVMPRMDGASATREIKARWPGVKIVLLLLDPGQGQSALDCGADAYLLKEGDTHELLEVLGEMGIAALDTDDPNILAIPGPDGSTVMNNEQGG